jgi:hypothetical protein
MEAKVSIGTCIQEYPDFVAGELFKGSLGPLEDNFSGAGSIMATRAVTPKSCFGSGVCI